MATYAVIEHNLYESPKLVGVSDKAFRAYIEAILYSGKHLTDGFLDERIVSRMWGLEAAEELATNDPTNPSWSRVDGGWKIYGFCERQNTKADVDAMRERKSVAGKASAAKRQQEANRKATEIQQAVEQKLNTGSTEVQPYTDTYTNNKEHMFNDVERNSEYSDDFEAWWMSYPRKQAKGDAWKAWKTLKKSLPPVEQLIHASAIYGLRVTDPQFLKMPGPWLRARRWEDAELVATPVAVPKRKITGYVD